REQLQVAARQPFEEMGNVGLGEIGWTSGQNLSAAGLIRLDLFVAVSMRELVVRVDEQPPEQFRAPRGQRLETDGLDAGEGHQAQHAEALCDADELGKLTDDVRILGVAAKCDL